MPEIIVRHPSGLEYGIDSASYRRGKHYRDPKSGDMQTYEEAGFKVVSNIDGTEYTGPLNEPERPSRAAATSRPEAEPKP